ncbi:MAG: hypothetical protein GIKADHBN_01628 [Phycisphaerales bacterium]|nr:hypothetical protein [Phycisphaerales bacterium]
MTHNPYAAPEAPLQDPGHEAPIRTRPKPIALVLQLAVVNYVIGAVTTVVAWDFFAPMQSIGRASISQLVSLAFATWVYYKIYKGRNWARVLLLTFWIVGVAVSFTSTVQNLMSGAPWIVKAQLVLSFGISLAIICLLFTSPGRDWFRKSSSGRVA